MQRADKRKGAILTVLTIWIYLMYYYHYRTHPFHGGLLAENTTELIASYELRLTKAQTESQQPLPPVSTRSCNNNTVHPWSNDILKASNITCGLSSIQQMAEAIITGESNSLTGNYKLILHQLELRLQNYSSPKTPAKQSNDGNMMPLFRSIHYKSVELNVNRTKHLSSTIAQHYLNPAAKTLAFVKAYKVGGTHIASLLTLHAYLYNLELGKISDWHSSLTTRKKNKVCRDIVGTNHPGTNFYRHLEEVKQRTNYTFYCKPAVEFMLVREPIQRIWSGYNHAKRSKSSLQLRTYLSDRGRELTKQPPHHMLSTSLSQATLLSENLLMLVSNNQTLMDKSLMLLSIYANLSICDLIYEPCTAGENWGTSKCNDYKTDIPTKDLRLIKEYIARSGEDVFYRQALHRFQKLVSNNSRLERRLKVFHQIQNEGLERCVQNSGKRYAETYLRLDPRVRQRSTQDDKNVTRWFLIGQDVHSIDPAWMCMQWFCHKVVGHFHFD